MRAVSSPPIPLSSADQALLDHATATLYFLRCYDSEWEGDIEVVRTHFVKVTTRRTDVIGPSLRLTFIAMPPQEQAMVIHEATVGRARARRDRAAYERYELYQVFATDEERTRHRQEAKERERLAEREARKREQRDRLNAKRRARRAVDPEWRASENQKRRERHERQRRRERTAAVLDAASAVDA